jgi:hypothetical protein
MNCPFLAIKIPLADRPLRTSYQMLSFYFLPVGDNTKPHLSLL